MAVISNCPFCGSSQVKPFECEDPYPEVGWTIDPVVVCCLTCGAIGPRKQFQDEDQAVIAWNTRV